MSLILLRRALYGAGLILCALAPLSHADDAAPTNGTPANPAPANGTPANGAAPAAKKESPIPVPVGADAAAPAVAQRKPPTPEEQRQQTEEKLRALMINLGITAAATQDAIIVYLAEDEMGRAGLRDSEKRLLTGLRRDVPPERMRDLLGDYRAATESAKANREGAQRKLDARIGYSLDPRLEATLCLMGVLGDGVSKLPTAALVARQTNAGNANNAGKDDGAAPENARPTAPIYGPPVSPNFGARGEIVGTVTAKGIAETGEHWLEIRDDSGATDRYAALWREDLGALDPDVEKQLAATPLSARVRVQWVWQERRRALSLQPEDATQAAPARQTPDKNR